MTGKKKAVYAALGASLLFFIYLFVRSVYKAIGVFKTPDDFTLVPFLYCLVLLVACVLHAGVYVVVMDKKPMNHVVTDDEEWWLKWDRV